MAVQSPHNFMTAEDAARYLGKSPFTLQWWRSKSRGPAYTRSGRQILYRRADLDAWLERQRVDPEAA